ncbi:MAG TPA: YihY/virulence factor BrkB family protein [Nitrolancea sp.]|nr:YihY/virulence factor BrkB family protein [Nitrolancea sp.]
MRFKHLVERSRQIYVVDLLYRAISDFIAQRGSVYAAAISYYAMFSLIPMLVLVATVFGWFSRGTDLQAHVVDAIVNQVSPSIGLRPQIEGAISVSAAQGGLLTLFGFAGTLWTTSSLFSVLRRALNRAFDIPTARPFFTGRLTDMLSMFVVGVLVLLSIGATATLGIIRAVSSDVFRGALANIAWGIVFFLLPFLLSFVVFMMIYRLVPNRQIHWRDRTIGALLAALGFELVKIGFTIYIANFGNYQRVYGAIGGVVAFLFFVQLESTIIILSAEIASELAKDHAIVITHLDGPRSVSLPGDLKVAHRRGVRADNH